MTEHTPRVNAHYLGKFIGHTVRIVGKVSELHGDSAIIDAQGMVTLILSRDDHMTVNNGVEAVGKVQPGLEVKVLTSWDLGSDVEYGVAEQVVEVTHRCKEIFYDS